VSERMKVYVEVGGRLVVRSVIPPFGPFQCGGCSEFVGPLQECRAQVRRGQLVAIYHVHCFLAQQEGPPCRAYEAS
jgi:predicted metal-binding protein